MTLSDYVTSIGDGAFSGSALTTVNIPASVTSIGEGVFDGCTGLTSLTVNEANSAFEMSGKVLLSKDKTTLVFSLVDHYDTYSVPDTVTTIYGDAFSDCKLTSVVIPNSVTTIGNYAFSGCSRLTTVTLGNGVEAISQGMFFSCKELTSLTIPNSVTTIGKEAFQNCGKLASLTIPNSVTTIGEGAFKYCSGLTEINIPGSVTSIGKGAFDGCTGLTNLTVDDSSSTYSLNNGALLSKNGEIMYFCLVRPDGEYTIPGTVTTIGEGAFEGCYDLTSVIIPDSVVTIGKNAFIRCGSLSSVTFGSNVETIGEGAFSECYGLSSVVIPNSVKTIGNNAFISCDGLRTVEIGNSVETIGDGAFYKCYGLESVTIPLSVKSIGHSAFSDLQMMRFTPEMATLDINHIGGSGAYGSADPNYRVELYKNAAMTVPVDSLNTYVGTIYFKWIRSSGESFTVTFDTNGGSPVEPQRVIDCGTAEVPAEPTREGYRFAGWYTDSGCTDEYDFSTQIAGDMTLYAGWEVKYYSIIFNADSGTFTDGSTKYLSFKYGEPIVAPEEPTRDGFVFAGWDPEIPATMPAMELRFTAKWIEIPPDQFYVNFITYGGTEVESQMVDKDGLVVEPTTTREGYTFTGWYTEGECSNLYDFSTPVTENMTLHAGWTEAEYLTTFDANSGIFSDGSETKDIKVKTGTEPGIEPPVRDGYTFTGWFMEPVTENVYDNIAREGMTIYAGWDPVTYTATFDANGGVFYNNEPTHPYDITTGTEPGIEPPVREGYIFTGWFMDSAATEPYDEIARENMTLYAGWKEEQFFLSSMPTADSSPMERRSGNSASRTEWIWMSISPPERDTISMAGTGILPQRPRTTA